MALHDCHGFESGCIYGTKIPALLVRKRKARADVTNSSFVSRVRIELGNYQSVTRLAWTVLQRVATGIESRSDGGMQASRWCSAKPS